MEQWCGAIQAMFNEECSLECLKSSLAFVVEAQGYNSNDNLSHSEKIISSINTGLHGSEPSRFKALCLLEKYLHRSPTDSFTANAILWMQHCTRWSQSTIDKELVVLEQLITLSIDNPDLKKQIIALILPKIVERLNKCKNVSKNSILSILSCLQVFIDGYSSSCGPFRNSFYKFIVNILKNHAESNDIVLRASQCFILLYHCGGGGHQNANHRETWSSHFRKLLITYQKLLDEIYENVGQVASITSDEPVMEDFLELKSEYLKSSTMRYYGLRRNCNILTCILRCMLLCKFPASKTFHAKKVLDLICRILSVTCITLQSMCVTNDTIALNANICFMHGYAFDLLHAVIISARRNLIVYGTEICKVCIQCLKWTSSISHSNEAINSLRTIRRKAYNTLNTWLTVAGSCSAVEVFVDELLPHVISDIECDRRIVTLVIDVQKGKNKRKRGHCAAEMNIPSALTSTKHTSVCRSALENLMLVIHNASIFIKWEHHKNVQSLIINQLLDIVKCNVQYKYPFPYSDPMCRLMLYRSLHVLFREPHPKWFAPTSNVIAIFNAGIHDSEIKVSHYCKEVVSTIEAINHPKAPTIHFKSENSQCTLSVEQMITLPERSLHNDSAAVNHTEGSKDELKDMPKVNRYHSAGNECKLSTVIEQRSSTYQTIKPLELNIQVNSAVYESLKSESKLSSIGTCNDTPPTKKKKNEIDSNIDSLKSFEDDSDVRSMLNDFVDGI